MGVLSLSENLNKGMGIARSVCKTNAKLAIKNRRESNTEVIRDALSFLFSLSDILCYRKE